MPFSSIFFVVACLFNSIVLAQYNDWVKAYAEADRVISTLTLSEKLTAGIPASRSPGVTKKAGVPPGIHARDGPAGIDGGFGVAGWVTPQTIACSWDRELITKQWKGIAIEFKKKGYNAMFSPTTGPLGRSVLGGRVFEGYVRQ
jgi:beta-glucosidase